MRRAKLQAAVAGVFALCVLVLGMGGCANMAAPEGGPYDMTPPRLLYATPPNGSVNVQARKYKLYFDENIRIEKQQEKVLISPPQLQQAKITAISRTVSIDLQDSLRPNTTYVIDFQNAIVDNNEGNPIDQFAYAFSTGDKLDSMQMSGIVLNARTLEPMRGVLVGAYVGANDTEDRFRKNPFDNVALTGLDGRFRFRNIADTCYRVFALKDMDNSYSYSQPSEAIAFVDSTYCTDMQLHRADSATNSQDSSAKDQGPKKQMVGLTGDTAATSHSGKQISGKPRADSLQRQSPSAKTDTVGVSIADSARNNQPAEIHYTPDDILLRFFVVRSSHQFIKKTSRIDSTTLSIEFAIPIDTLPRLTLLSHPTSSGQKSLLTSGLHCEGNTSAVPIAETDSTSHQTPADTASIRTSPDSLSLATTSKSNHREVNKKAEPRFHQTDWYLATRTAPTRATYFLTRPDLLLADTVTTTLAYTGTDSLSRPIIISDTIQWIRSADLGANDGGTREVRKSKDSGQKEPPKHVLPEYRIRINGSEGIVAGTPLDTIYINLSHPTVDSLPQYLHLEQTKDTVWTAVKDYSVRRSCSNPLRYEIASQWVYAHQYRLRVDSASMHSIYGEESRKVEFGWSIGKEEEFGAIDLKLKDAPSSAVVELLDAKDKILWTARPIDEKVSVPNLKPGDYYARLFVDDNNNGEWDTGEYPDKQPEAVYYCPQTLAVKAKFTTGEIWPVNATPLWEQRPEALREKPAELEQDKSRKNLNEEYERRMAERQKKKKKKDQQRKLSAPEPSPRK